LSCNEQASIFDLVKEIYTMIRKLAVLLLCLSLSRALLGQSNPTAVTNSDLIKMVNAGIGDQTIILAIQRGPTMLDTSPQALVLLKMAAVSDQVLNTILAVTRSQSEPQAQAGQTASTVSPDKSHGTSAQNAAPTDDRDRYRRPESPRAWSPWHFWRSKS
jgi:hypothetical protein